MKILKTSHENFKQYLDAHLKKRSQTNNFEIEDKVKEIINNIIKDGDEALFRYSKKFDNSLINKSNILLSKKERVSYKNQIDLKTLASFKIAIKNITNFHEKQKPNDYEIIKTGIKTSLVWKPIDSVGLYIPGGTAVYPSSLIMNVIPAKVAGIKRIVVVTPYKSDQINPYILALLDELEITEVYKVGGAQAIAALAYGTESILPVNKIFGPGNSYVASAKKQVFGKVGIDIIAGPSEIVVVADKNNNPSWVAADLIAQAEHDENAQSILITDNEKFSSDVIVAIHKLTENIEKKLIIKKSLENYGLIILTENINNISDIINFIAPEHLHLQNQQKFDILKDINNAGGIFVGEYACEAFGDYIVGTNHILPTYGSAKFSSGLGVLDFMKRTSIVEMNYAGYKNNQDHVSKMAKIENLTGHSLSVKIRQIEKK